MAITLPFDKPPEKAVEYFRSKGYEIGFGWQDVYGKAHQTAFTVAKAMRLDILQDIRDGVDKAIAEGKTFQQFRSELEPLLKRKGWWGKKEMTDPLTGEIKMATLGTPWRLRTIFQTNVQSAYQAGRYARMKQVAGARPFWMYDAVNDGKTRLAHAAWDGLILRHDDPWWSTHYPPNGYNCRCSVISMSQREMDRGRLVDDPDNPGEKIRKPYTVSEAPPVEYVERRDMRTGQMIRHPRGIDPGFDHAPDQSWTPDPGKHTPEIAAAGEKPRPLRVATRADVVRVIKEKLDSVTLHGIKEIDFRRTDAFMATDSAGRITISTKTFGFCRGFNAAADLRLALQNLGREPLTFNQEYALESLWHEINHNRQPWTWRAGRLDARTTVMETVNQWVSRRTYPEMLEHLGGFKPEHLEAITTGGYGYNGWIRNFDGLLAALGVEDGAILEDVYKMLLTVDRMEYMDELAGILAKTSGRDAAKIKTCLKRLEHQGAPEAFSSLLGEV